MKIIMYWFIIIVAAFAINGTFGLVMNEREIGMTTKFNNNGAFNKTKLRYYGEIYRANKYILNIYKYLQEDYSPEQIAGRAALDNLPCVSHESIYQFIWDDKKKGGRL